MSNVFERFINLIPRDAEFVGTITQAQHPEYKVLVVDGSGLVACTSSTVRYVGECVFIQGQTIIRPAPAGDVLQIEV